MEVLDFTVILFVQLLEVLFFSTAEKNSTSQGPARISGAARAELVGASPTPGSFWIWRGNTHKQRQFYRRQIKPMVVQVELAAVPSAQADRSGTGNGAVGVFIDSPKLLHHCSLGATARDDASQVRFTG